MIGEKYGMMTDKEATLLDELLGTIKAKFGEIRFLEIGTCGGGTTAGVYKWAKENNCPVHAEGVDNVAGYCMADPPADYIFHCGDSMDMWSKIVGREFNLLFVDGCHCLNHAQCDFLNYSPFVTVGGFCLFHDTAPNANGGQGEWPQNHGYAGLPPSVLGVREALVRTGILQGRRADWKLVKESRNEGSELMGMCLFEKKLPLL
jgi:Methyltransferase domain